MGDGRSRGVSEVVRLSWSRCCCDGGYVIPDRPRLAVEQEAREHIEAHMEQRKSHSGYTISPSKYF